MLELLFPYITNSSPRLLPAWNEYVDNLETFQSQLMKRFILGTDHETKGIALLRYILSSIDYNYMQNQVSDFDIYTFYLRHIQEDIENKFEHTTLGTKFYNLFIDNHLGKIQEFIIPIEDISVTQRLPFDKSWDVWKYVRPVRYLAHDSTEFTQYMEADRIRFRNNPPTHGVVSIDVIALIFKYFKYMTISPNETEWTGKDQRRFLHKHVLSFFLYDLLDIFLINQIKNISNVSSIDEINTYTANNATYSGMYGFVGHRYHEASKLLYNEFTKIKNGQTRPSMILSSPLLSHGKSIYDVVNMMVNRCHVPYMRQFQCFRVMRDMHLFSTILNIFEYRKTEHLYKTIQRNVGPKIRKYIRDKVWTYVHDPILESYMQSNLNIFNEKLYSL